MTDKNIPIEYAANWLCQMAAADGVLSAREKHLLTEFANHYGLDSDLLIRKAYVLVKRCETPEVEPVDSRQLAGLQFEKFVVSLCSNRERFQLLAWRGDKISGSTYAIDTLLPDLHIRHRLEANVVEYFVECKYRSMLPDGALDLNSQLGRYRGMASAKTNSELFIAVGVGGTPYNPAQFYVIPSRMIKGDGMIRLQNFSKCLCMPSADSFHGYINHFFNKRVFKKYDS